MLDAGGLLLAEAGTGTGKTLAYLLPAVDLGRRVVVSTGTKNLQEQLFFKDVPFLRKLFPHISVTLMKGRSNYLCLLKYERVCSEPMLPAPGSKNAWPENGAEPSGATARPSEPMAEAAT